MFTNLAVVSFVLFSFGTPSFQQEAGSSYEVTVPVFPNATCPIMGKPASNPLFADTDRGRIYICCKKCVSKIQADVEKAHKTAYPVIQKAGNATCPVTGEKIEKDSPTVVLQGYEISVCCEDCVQEVKTNSQIALVKATDSKVTDIENEICPITEKPVTQNAFCLIGKDLIHLSSTECVEQVKKDPKKALEKAKELKAKQGTKSESKKKEHKHDEHGKEEKDHKHD